MPHEYYYNEVAFGPSFLTIQVFDLVRSSFLSLALAPNGECREKTAPYPEKCKFLAQTCSTLNIELLQSARGGDVATMELLLKSGANVLQTSACQKLAIEIAYQYKHWRCVLLLLKHNSPFPKNFDECLIPDSEEELLQWVGSSRFFAKSIENGDFSTIKNAIDDKLIYPTFRSVCNKSAVNIAFSNKKYEIFVLLKSNGFNEFKYEGPFEINKLPNEARRRIKFSMFMLIK